MAKIPVKRATARTKATAVKVGASLSNLKPQRSVTHTRSAKEAPQKNSHKQMSAVITPKSLHRGAKLSVSIKDNTLKSKKEVPPVIEKASKAKKNAIVPRESKLPATLSKFRFPVPSEFFVAHVARIAGIFFVAAGAVLSLLNLSAVDGFSGQQASLTTATLDTSSVTTLSSSTSEVALDTTPDVRILIDGSHTIVMTVPVMITVSGAYEVKLFAKSSVDSHVFLVGSAFKVDSSTWRTYWNSVPLLNGEYRLFATVSNSYGTYDYFDSTSYVVSNIIETTPTGTTSGDSGSSAGSTPGGDPVSTSTTTTTTDTEVRATSTVISSTSSTTDVVLADQSVSLHVMDSSPVHGETALKIYAKNPSEVKIYARNTATYVVYFAGYATLENDTLWKFNWNTTKIPDGTYALRAKAKFGDLIVSSALVKTTVENGTETEEARADELFQANQDAVTSSSGSLEPKVSLKFSQEGLFSNSVQIEITTSPVVLVEMYALSKSSLTPYFLGLATKVSEQKWNYVWETNQTPNGEYYLYTRVKTDYGYTEGGRQTVRVLNEVVSSLTTEQEKTFDTFNTADDTLVKTTTDTEAPKDAFPAPEVVYIKPVDVFLETIQLEDDSKEEVEDVLTNFNGELNQKLDELAFAIRGDDADGVIRIKGDIETLKSDTLSKVNASGEDSEISKNVHSYLTERAFELQELTTKNEKILKERFGESIVKDSDTDGISDYDEINLYRTNPFAADTDGDGYIDSVEVRLGYNPHSSNSEALVVYESPKETGIEREDILVIESITTLSQDDPSADSKKPIRAIISGKGLPNSFITLYMYSTPIVVTVKTDSEGGWSYVFDKELEDGDHEVFAGITDNAGRIVAKSHSFPFVKTAEAFAGAKPTLQNSVVSEPSLIKENSLLLVASIAVSALGLVLILLGLHASRRKDEPLAHLST